MRSWSVPFIAAARVLGLFGLFVQAMDQTVSPHVNLFVDEQKEWMEKGFLKPTLTDSGLIPGSLYHIRNIHIQCSQKIDLSDLSLDIYKGKRASKKSTEYIHRDLSRFFLNHGFIFAAIQSQLFASQDTGDKWIDLTFILTPGPGYKLGDFHFKGTKTKHTVLQRLSLLRFGETVNLSRLEQARDKLARHGYFGEVLRSGFYRDSTRHVLYPVFIIQDIPGYNINGLLGYTSEEQTGNKLSGQLDISLKNLMGTARDFEFHFSSQRRQKQIALRYKEPWIGPFPFGVEAGFNFLLEDSVYNEFNWRVAFFQDISFISRTMATFQYQTNETQPSSPDLSKALQSKAYITGLKVLLDWRDASPYTSQGAFINTELSGTRRESKDSVDFLLGTKQTMDYWFPLFSRFIFHQQLVHKANWPLSASLKNRGDLFQLGGANTIRGYLENSFMTNLAIYTKLEFQYLLSNQNRIFLFIDPALVNRLKSSVHWNRHLGYGLWAQLGNRDWIFGLGYALNPEREVWNGLIHANVQNHF